MYPLISVDPASTRLMYVETQRGVFFNYLCSHIVVLQLFTAETWGRLGQRVADLAKTVEDRATFPVDFNIQHTFDVSSQSKPAQVRFRVDWTLFALQYYFTCRMKACACASLSLFLLLLVRVCDVVFFYALDCDSP